MLKPILRFALPMFFCFALPTAFAAAPVTLQQGPTVTGINPPSGGLGQTIDVRLTGTNFVSGMRIWSGLELFPAIPGITVINVSVTDSTTATARLRIDAEALPGLRTVVVTTSDGTAVVNFFVLPFPPTLEFVQPNIGSPGQQRRVLLPGTNHGWPWGERPTVSAGAGIVVSEVAEHCLSQYLDEYLDYYCTAWGGTQALLSIAADATLGPRSVTLTTSGGASNSVDFTVVPPSPDLSISASHDLFRTIGSQADVNVSIANVGTGPTTGTITVTDTLPAGLTFLAGTGTGWSCSASGQNVTCLSAAGLAVDQTTTLHLTVGVVGGAVPDATHSLSLTTDGDLTSGNNNSTPVPVWPNPSPFFVVTPVRLVTGQPSRVEVVLTQPLPYEVSGLVTLTFSSDVHPPSDDPAIQFATGGKSVNFTIPAGQTRAGFGSAPQLAPLDFQTGTVAGTLQFAGTFTAGTLEGIFFSARDASLAIPRQAPSINSIRTRTEGGFAVDILLHSTLREVTQMSLSFNTTPRVRLSCGTITGCSVSGNTLILDVASLFTTWFNSGSAFGGLAMLRLPLSVGGGTVRGSVSITLRNSQGESNPQSFTLP